MRTLQRCHLMCCRDLAQHVYRNIADKFRRQALELKTTEMATHDLEKYHKVGAAEFHHIHEVLDENQSTLRSKCFGNPISFPRSKLHRVENMTFPLT